LNTNLLKTQKSQITQLLKGSFKTLRFDKS